MQKVVQKTVEVKKEPVQASSAESELLQTNKKIINSNKTLTKGPPVVAVIEALD